MASSCPIPIHEEARKDCLRLLHLLFDGFVSVEECQNAVAFGKHGKVPEGKAVLDKSKVDGIESKYIVHFVDLSCFVELCVCVCVGLFQSFVLQHFTIIYLPIHYMNSWQ